MLMSSVLVERVDVLGRDPEFLGGDRGEDRPVDRLGPLGVAIGDRGSEWLLGEDLRQDRQGIGPFRVGRPQAGELADVGRPAVTLPCDERFLDEVDVLERDVPPR